MKKLIVGCAILLLLTASGFYLWMARDTYYVDTADRSVAASVAAAFTWALVENKEVKPLVIPTLWPDLDKWVIVHEVFRCPSIFPFAQEPSYGLGGPIVDGKTRYDYIYELHCPGFDHRYYFEVTGIALEKGDSGWLITDWEGICEMRPGEDECHNPLD